MIKTTLSLILLALACLNANAEISYIAPDQKRFPTILVSGRIKSQDAVTFKKLIDVAISDAQIKNGRGEKLYRVELNSMGGSVSAAMEMGKAIHKTAGMVVVDKGATCVSSCVLILAGGNERGVYGKVGIHRPYLSDDNVDTPSGQEASYKNIESSIKQYLTAVNVPTSLYDAMFRIPPEKVRYLTARELESYNLNENDPYYQEAEDTVIAKKWGMTKAQFIQFKAATANQCSTQPIEQVSSCLTKVANAVKAGTTR